MSATLTLKRENRFAIELRRAPFQITLDGRAVGTLDRNETFEAPVQPGRHSLQVRAGRYSSRAQTFDVGEGDAVNFWCHGANLWPVYVASLVVPSVALSLRRE